MNARRRKERQGQTKRQTKADSVRHSGKSKGRENLIEEEACMSIRRDIYGERQRQTLNLSGVEIETETETQAQRQRADESRNDKKNVQKIVREPGLNTPLGLRPSSVRPFVPLSLWSVVRLQSSSSSDTCVMEYQSMAVEGSSQDRRLIADGAAVGPRVCL